MELVSRLYLDPFQAHSRAFWIVQGRNTNLEVLRSSNLFFLQSAIWSQDPKPLSHLRLKRLLLDAAVVRGLLLVVRGRRVGGGGGAVRRLRPLIGGLRGGVGGFRGRIGGGCRGGVWRSCWCFVGRGGGRVSKRGFRCGKEGGEARAAVEGMSLHLCR